MALSPEPTTLTLTTKSEHMGLPRPQVISQEAEQDRPLATEKRRECGDNREDSQAAEQRLIEQCKQEIGRR